MLVGELNCSSAAPLRSLGSWTRHTEARQCAHRDGGGDLALQRKGIRADHVRYCSAQRCPCVWCIDELHRGSDVVADSPEARLEEVADAELPGNFVRSLRRVVRFDAEPRNQLNPHDLLNRTFEPFEPFEPFAREDLFAPHEPSSSLSKLLRYE